MVAVLLERLKRNSLIVASLLASAGLVVATVSPALAAPTNASLRLGDSRPDATDVAHTFTLQSGTTSNVGCVEVDLGTAADGSGDPVGGGTPTLDSGTLFGTFGDWSVRTTDWASDRKLQATHGTTGPLNASGNVVWSGVTNGSTADTAYFAIYTVYSDNACSTPVADETITVNFIYTDGTDVSLTVDPAFTFTVAGVNSGNDVDSDDTASEDTTVTTTATTVPFSNSVTTSTNGVGSQDLTINTNAQNGYNIYFRQTQALTNGGSETIDAVSVPQGTDCTYAVPQPFTAAGSEAFGFTTDDADISSGAYQDGAGDNDWCDVVGSDQVVATNSTSLTGAETTRVSYQVGISASTEAGTYQNTIIYTAVPTY
jgi:hypothetical protein